MLRRLASEQPENFAFTDANQKWAEAQMQKYPEGRQASAIIPLLWRAQEQEGWLSRPAIEYVADMLGLAYIRALEVATFYFMFQLQPVGKIAHIQVCGTTPCMLRGSEELMAVCKEKIANKAHLISEDGNFSWEEVECLGACTNAPMVQIGKDFYEDLTPEDMGRIIDTMAAGEVPPVGPQNDRFSSEPSGGARVLNSSDLSREDYSGSRARAEAYGDTIARITGGEGNGINAEITSGVKAGQALYHGDSNGVRDNEYKVDGESAKQTTSDHNKDAEHDNKGDEDSQQELAPVGQRPQSMDTPRDGNADDLKLIKGVGPKLEELLHSLGFYHFDQIATWNADEVAWVDENLEGFKGRVTRDEWVDQAKILAAGGETEFSARNK